MHRQVLSHMPYAGSSGETRAALVANVGPNVLLHGANPKHGRHRHLAGPKPKLAHSPLQAREHVFPLRRLSLKCWWQRLCGLCRAVYSPGQRATRRPGQNRAKDGAAAGSQPLASLARRIMVLLDQPMYVKPEKKKREVKREDGRGAALSCARVEGRGQKQGGDSRCFPHAQALFIELARLGASASGRLWKRQAQQEKASQRSCLPTRTFMMSSSRRSCRGPMSAPAGAV